MQYSQWFAVDGVDQFGVFFLPDEKHWPKDWVLVCPAFAEEQNKSRALVARQSRLWCQRGFGVLHIDLHGTGDSPLSLTSKVDGQDIGWDVWVDQVFQAAKWLKGKGACTLNLFGLRLGALLALSVIEKSQLSAADSHQIDGDWPFFKECLMWQPVLSGKSHITQFLRLRTASMAISGEAQESVANLRQMAKEQGFVEVAGYRLPHALIRSIDQVSAKDLSLNSALRLQWVDITRNLDKSLPPVATKLLRQWRDQGVNTDVHRVSADGFWSSQELVDAPDLLAISETMFSLNDGAGAPLESSPLPKGECSAGSLFSTTISTATANLSAMLHQPQRANGQAVVIVVGGPQYRVGSHRQFFELAEYLRKKGFLVLRFDCRGMGDSEGEFPGFEYLDQDIAAAVDHLYQLSGSLKGVSLWGLCDAATACSFYAAKDHRIQRLILLNPWVRSEAGLAQARMTHYYGKRLLDVAFWKKLLSGRVNATSAISSFVATVKMAIIPERQVAGDAVAEQENLPEVSIRGDLTAPLIAQMQQSLAKFQGRVLVVLSGRDLTAQEFEQQVDSNTEFAQWLQRESVTIERFPEADHTFSRYEWKSQLEQMCDHWLSQIV